MRMSVRKSVRNQRLDHRQNIAIAAEASPHLTHVPHLQEPLELAESAEAGVVDLQLSLYSELLEVRKAS